MIAAHELDLAGRLQKVRTVVAMDAPNELLLSDNPLGKIPTLVLEDGTSLFDSLVICEYLESIAGGNRLFPREGEQRFDALTRHALGSGFLDLLILWRNERNKPLERQTASWLGAFAIKSAAVLDRLEAAPPPSDRFDIGHIAVGCALSYLDFRFPEQQWREGRPQVAQWHESFARRPSVLQTEIVDDK